MKVQKLLPITLIALSLMVVAPLVWAGPITGGSGNPPFTKLGVYQGVIAIVPGLSGDSVMEIGNAGRDIASTGSIYLRPGSADGQGANIVIAPQNSVNEGGEIIFQGAAAYQPWTADIWQNRFRIHTNGNERLVIDGATGGNIYIPTGSLCFGGVGSTDCKNSWTGLGGGSGGTPTLDQVLGGLESNPPQNQSNQDIVLAPVDRFRRSTAKLEVQQYNTPGSDGISVYFPSGSLTGNAGLYVEQNAEGYGAYLTSNAKTAPTSTLYSENTAGGRTAYFHGYDLYALNNPGPTPKVPTVSIYQTYNSAPGGNQAQTALEIKGGITISDPINASTLIYPNGLVNITSGNGGSVPALKVVDTDNFAASFSGAVVFNNSAVKGGLELAAISTISSSNTCTAACSGLSCLFGVSGTSVVACGTTITSGTCLCK